MFRRVGQLPATEDRVSLLAPPCGTGLSAALKPRFAGLHPSGFHPWRKHSRADAQSVSSEVACGVTAVESESADRVCRDGLKVGREASGARRGEPRCPDTPHEPVPAMTARAFTLKSLTRSSPSWRPGVSPAGECSKVAGLAGTECKARIAAMLTCEQIREPSDAESGRVSRHVPAIGEQSH